MKTDDMVQWGLLALIAFLAYQKFVKDKKPSQAAQPPFELDPNFGIQDPTGGWD